MTSPAKTFSEMTIFRIKDWETVFEVSDSRKVDGPLKWVAVRTASDGFGYSRITLEKNKCELLAAWYLIVAVSAKQPRSERGKLTRDGVPLSPEDFEILTRFPAEVFERAIAYFSDPRMGWLIRCDPEGNPAEPVRTAPDESERAPATGHYRTLQDRTGQSASAGAPAVVVSIPASLDSETFRSAWSKWVEVRSKGKKPKTPLPEFFAEQLAWLEKFGPVVGSEIVLTSFRNGWQGLFEPKGGKAAAKVMR